MGLLDSLASGLRGVGMTLSPGVFNAGVAQDNAQQAQNQLRQNLLISQVIKGVESGAIPQNHPIVAQLGLPQGAIGPTPETSARIEAAKRDADFRRQFSKLDPQSNDYYDKVIQIAGTYGKQDLAMNALKAKEDRLSKAQTALDALNERSRATDLRHEERMMGIEYRAERDAATEQYRADKLELARQQQAMVRALKNMGGEGAAKTIYDADSLTGLSYYAPGKSIHGKPAPAPAGFLSKRDKDAAFDTQISAARTQINALLTSLKENPRSTASLFAPLIQGTEALASSITGGGGIGSAASDASVLKASLIKNLTPLIGSLSRESNKDTAILQNALGLINTGTTDSVKKGLEIWGGILNDVVERRGSNRPSPDTLIPDTGKGVYVETVTTRTGKRLGKKADGTVEEIR